MSQRSWAEDILAQASDSMRAAHSGLQVSTHSVADAPVEALLAAAEEADLLVLGSHGISGVAGFLTGSVSQRVVARSPRPVVLVRAGECIADEHFSAVDGISPDEIPETPYRDVVLGLDTHRPCDELIEFAFDAARRRAARSAWSTPSAVRPPTRRSTGSPPRTTPTCAPSTSAPWP